MFSFFSKSNLNLQERALLVSTLVEAHLVGYLTGGQWLGERQRADIIHQWLTHMEKKAGSYLRLQLSETGNEIAQMLLARSGKEGLEDMLWFFQALDGDNKDERAVATTIHGQLLDECEQILINKGLAV